MEPGVFLAALLIFVGIPALTVIKLARLRAARPQALSDDVTARLEALESRLQDLQPKPRSGSISPSAYSARLGK